MTTEPNSAVLVEYGVVVVVVEVPGIEPGSFVHVTGLLRAQFTSSLLGPTDLANESV